MELWFKRDWSREKAKKLGYKFSVRRRTQFCPPSQSKLLINKHLTVTVLTLDYYCPTSPKIFHHI